MEVNNERPEVLLFDVYGTLLDMSLVEKKVNAVLNNKRGYAFWFEMLMQYCFVDNSLNSFHPFGEIAKATLQMTADILDEKVSEDTADEVLELLNHLPLKEDEMQNLSDLYELGFRMAALTNAPQAIIESRMERTGLVSYFEKVLSTESVQKYKPAIEVYQWAAREMKIDMNRILLVSTHNWDIAGAATAGMQTAYLQQENYMAYRLSVKPDYIIGSIDELKRILTSE